MYNCVYNILCVFVATILVVRISGDITHPKNNPVIDSRIVGGKVVNIMQYPHQISLRTRDITEPQQSYAHSCGGIIYSDRIVITASHCVEHTKLIELMVVVGTNLRNGIDGVIVPVQEILMHDQYTSRNNNDIALLVLASALPINNITIKPIELTDGQPQHGEIATITGWGVDDQGDSPDFLHEVQVPIISNEICNQSYPNRITDDMLCAGLLGVGGKDACKKDSGGPLLVNGKLAGVVSWGTGCALPNFPGVYANIWYLLPWLRENIARVEAKFLEAN